MKYLLFLLSFSSFAVEFTDAFIVTVYDKKIRVTSPKKKTKLISIIIKNKTAQDIRSEVATEKKVIKRFNLKAESSRSLEVDYSKIGTLYYVSIAPPFQSVELKFSERPYEIPPKKK